MALFGKPHAFVGLDIGSSSLKVVELIDRNKRVEVATYASAEMGNKLIDPEADAAVVKETADVITQLLEHGDVAADTAVVALPNSIVFSTVLKLPDVEDEQMAKAVQAAARDVVPANLNELTLSWSRLGAQPHSEGEPQAAEDATSATHNAQNIVPVFVTAAPKLIVERYQAVVKAADLELLALEVETAPLTRSLLGGPKDSALIVDIGDAVTTFHIIDQGTPRVTHSVDDGGLAISQEIAGALSISAAEAEQFKKQHGLEASAPAGMPAAAQAATKRLTDEASQVVSLYADQEGRQIKKTLLIGGGALLKGLAEFWSNEVGHQATVGNPWKGLAYPQELEARVKELGPSYAVAIGLAQRGIQASS